MSLNRVLVALVLGQALAAIRPAPAQAADLRLEVAPEPVVFRPLDEVAVDTTGGGTVSVLDGTGHEYVRRPAAGRVTFVAGGAPGTHTVRLLGVGDGVESSARFRLEPHTEIEDAGGRMEDLLRIARSTMESSLNGGVGVLEWRGGTYSNVAHWWYPGSFHGSWPEGYGQPKRPPLVRLVWKGKSEACTSVGLYWYGLNNPHPDRPVKAVAFSSTLDEAIYAVVGLTVSDQPIDQPLPPVSYGGPDNWAAGAVVYALVEGLAGVVDEDVAYQVAGVAPRWLAAGTDAARVVVHYPASDIYVAYDYHHDPVPREIIVTVTGSGQRVRCHVLLPDGVKAATSVVVGGTPAGFTTSRVQASAYADFDLVLPGPRTVLIRY